MLYCRHCHRFPEQESLISFSKRALVIQCGVLSCVINHEVSNRFKKLVAGVHYDLVTDYPYKGATGGKSRLFLFQPTWSWLFSTSALKHHPPLTNISLPPTGKIGVFYKLQTVGNTLIERAGWADTGYGGVRFSFRAPSGVAWFQVIFIGDNVATAPVDFYITRLL